LNKTMLITGGCGFIGSNFIHYMRRAHPDVAMINLDKLSYAANPANLGAFEGEPHYRFVHGDVADEDLVGPLLRKNRIGTVIHFAAESHVDRSILAARDFVLANVLGTHSLMEMARQHWEKTLSKDPGFRFVHISTDEIYGTLGKDGLFSEEHPFRPNSPYAATKAGADLLVRAYFETYGLPALIVRPSNNYGPYQFPEKFIPLMITNLLEDKPIPIYGRGLNVRDWIFVEDTCRAIDVVAARGKPGEAYNAGGESEERNVEVARHVLTLLGKDESYLEFVQDRPGHDLRYALNNDKIRSSLAWEPTVTFQQGLAETLAWYKSNDRWWKPLKQRLARESKGFWSKS
jgi:dTDP-glucose 4,6-dehydratase